MNKYEILESKVKMLEYHQKLLLKLLDNPQLEFYRLIIEAGLSERDVEGFYCLCDKMSIQLEEQKAEGYVNFHPLFDKLSTSLPKKLAKKKVVKACLTQNLYEPLFREFEKYI